VSTAQMGCGWAVVTKGPAGSITQPVTSQPGGDDDGLAHNADQAKGQGGPETGDRLQLVRGAVATRSSTEPDWSMMVSRKKMKTPATQRKARKPTRTATQAIQPRSGSSGRE
jgi:hypothetical protein